MAYTERPPSLGDREVRDMITDLRGSENADGTCNKHGLLVRSAILGHRQSEQIDFKVSNIQMQLEVLMANKFSPKTKAAEKHFKFALGKIFKGDFEGFNAGSICVVIVVMVLSIGLFAVGYSHMKMSKRLDTVMKVEGLEVVAK